MISGVNAAKRWVLGGLVLAVLLAVAAWFLFIGPKFDEVASIQDQTETTITQNTVLQGKVAKLKADSEGITALQQQLRDLHEQLPTRSDLDAFTRQLTGQAAAAGVTVDSIVIGVPAAVDTGDQKASTGSSDSAGDAASDTADAASGSGDTSDGANAPKPAKKPAGLYTIPVTVSATGPLKANRAFVDAVQTTGPRNALVSSVALAPADESSKNSSATSADAAPSGQAMPSTATGPAAADATPTAMTLQLAVFVAPQTPGDEAALQKQLGD